MSGKASSGTGKIVLTVVLILIALAAVIIGYRAMHIKKVSAEADDVLKTMYEIVPELGDEDSVQSGDGKDPLPAVPINEIDIIGCLEAPSIDLMVPVTQKSEARAGFASYLDGSAVKGRLRLTGNRDDVFGSISKLKPGAKVAFTDMDGVRYSYRVLTQFHLKKWDKADYDIMLTYKVDDDTRFVVAANRIA